MKILLTGATGYIGKRLLPVLVKNGHKVICCVRDKSRFNPPNSILQSIEVIEVDFLKKETLDAIPTDINAAYYLIHSMSTAEDYNKLELLSAKYFKEQLQKTTVEQVIYLSGIVNEKSLSKHLASRKAVEDELGTGTFSLTTLRAGIIIGSGSASFEIIRDLVEKLPVMVAPKWLNTKCQPISVADVIQFLEKSLKNEKVYNQSFDIGGPDVLTYKQMLLGFANVRGLKRYILTVPVMTPRLSSYWLYFITSTSYKLAVALVNSMKIEVVCRNNEINNLLQIKPVSYTQALKNAFRKIESNEIISSWKDSFISGQADYKISDFLQVPTHGCFIDNREIKIENPSKCIENIWKVGGKNGWYFANSLWKFRGFLDQVFGGVGLRRGRTHPTQISPGDSIDFWRVLYANKEEGRLLLYAEMKLPGEAWLEFNVNNNKLIQTATFRPIGVLGRLYWYSVLPFHGLIFNGMMKRLAR